MSRIISAKSTLSALKEGMISARSNSSNNSNRKIKSKKYVKIKLQKELTDSIETISHEVPVLAEAKRVSIESDSSKEELKYKTLDKQPIKLKIDSKIAYRDQV